MDFACFLKYILAKTLIKTGVSEMYARMNINLIPFIRFMLLLWYIYTLIL
jgi:hypothetical protein